MTNILKELNIAKVTFQQRAILSAMGVTQKDLVELQKDLVELERCDICGDIHEDEIHTANPLDAPP